MMLTALVWLGLVTVGVVLAVVVLVTLLSIFGFPGEAEYREYLRREREENSP